MYLSAGVVFKHVRPTYHLQVKIWKGTHHSPKQCIAGSVGGAGSNVGSTVMSHSVIFNSEPLQDRSVTIIEWLLYARRALNPTNLNTTKRKNYML